MDTVCENIINNRQQHNPPSWVQNVKMVGTQPLKNDKMQNIKTECVKVQNVKIIQTTRCKTAPLFYSTICEKTQQVIDSTV